MDLQAGEHATDYKEVATKDKLNELQLRIRQLLDQVDQITKEQNYQRVSYHNPASRPTVTWATVPYRNPCSTARIASV